MRGAHTVRCVYTYSDKLMFWQQSFWEDFYHSQRITQSTDQGGERDAFILCKYFTKLEPNEEGGLS